MAFERIWDDARQAWVWARGSERKTYTDDVKADIDDLYKRLGHEKKSPAQQGGSGTPVEPVDNASGNGESKDSLEQKSGTPQKLADTQLTKQQVANALEQRAKEARENAQKAIDEIRAKMQDESTLDEFMDGIAERQKQQREKQRDQSQGESKGNPQGNPQQDKSEEKKPKPNENNIFDRWDVEVFEHFAFMVNKENPAVHVRFPHTVHVPHMHVEINVNDVNLLVEYIEDFRFMRENKFRKNVIDPLLDETYKKAA